MAWGMGHRTIGQSEIRISVIPLTEHIRLSPCYPNCLIRNIEKMTSFGLQAAFKTEMERSSKRK